MKKIISILLSVTIILSALFGFSALAQAADLNENLIKKHTSEVINLVKREGVPDSDGIPSYEETYNIDGDNHRFYIKYMEDSNCLQFGVASIMTISGEKFYNHAFFKYYAPVSTTTDMQIVIMYSRPSLYYYEAETNLNIRSYDADYMYPYTVTSALGSASSDRNIQKNCNTYTYLLLSGQNLVLFKQFGYGLEGLGFTRLCTEHNTVEEVVTKPTATTLGYSTYYCSRCGVKFGDYTAPTGKLTLKCKARTVAAQTVIWNNVKNATGYQVQISNAAGNKWSTYANLKAGVTSYTFKKLAAGNNYKFRVRFYIAAGGKNYFSPWSSTLTSPTLPSGTTLTKLTPAKKAFTAQWKKAGVTGYQIQYSTSASFSGAKKLTIKNAKNLKATVKSLSAKKTYYVRIRTYKTISKVNYFSTWSKTYKVKTK